MSTKLSPRNVFLIALAACVLVIGLWYMLRFQPRQQQISDLSSQLDTLNTQVATLRTAAARLPTLRSEVEAMRTDRETFLAALPSAANFGPVLDELRTTTAATGARMNNFSVQTGNVTNLPSGVRPLNLTVGINGTFSQVFQTLRDIETMSRFTTVSNVSLQLPTATSFDPALEGSLGMTVYTFDPSQAAAQTGGTTGTPAAPSAPPAAPGGTQ